MTLISLLFDEKHQYLGELATSDGVLKSFVLNEDGEQLLGGMIKEWQTQGIPMFSEVTERSEEETTIIMYEDRVLMRDAKFLDALRIWIAKRGYHLISADLQVLDCWQIMLSLPLNEHERYAMVYALCRVPEAEIGTWKQALEQSMEAVAKERA